MDTAAIPAELRNRVMAAATALYERGGRRSVPTVDAVRREAKVDMNVAGVVMREWRQALAAQQAAPVAIHVPEAVQQASARALAALWQQAEELASERLRAAQAAWDKERAELEALREEVAAAYEVQATALQEVELRLQVAERSAQDAVHTAAVEGARADRAEVRAAEVMRGAEDLRVELAKVHRESDQARSECNQLQQAASEARERAAALAGQVEALQGQNAALLATLTPAAARRK